MRWVVLDKLLKDLLEELAEIVREDVEDHGYSEEGS